jgi:hypothetical protein
MILTLASALAALTLQAPDPLAPARDGKLLCITPNVAAKSCNAISSYAWGADGAILSETRSIINAAPMIVLVSRTPVTMRGDLECSSTAGYAGQIAAVEVDGQPLAGEQLDGVRQMIAGQLSAALGEGEMCSSWGHPGADGVIDYTVTMDGTPKPELAGAALWIGADEGWRVAL